LSSLRKYVEKLQVSLKSNKNNEYFAWRHIYFGSHLAKFFLEWEMFKKCYIENHNTRFTINNIFENCAVYEIIWKSIVEPGSPHMTIWRMRIACWIPNITKLTDNTGCPTRYRTRHFFNNSNINEDIATKQTHTTDTFLFISHTTNVLLFKFRLQYLNCC
jgi:hypothetical protein